MRSFALSYWADGLAQRSERAARAARLAAAQPPRAGRTCRSRSATSAWCWPTTCSRSRRRCRACRTAAETARCTSCCRPTTPRCTIPLVAAALPSHAADRALLVDDASPDETAAVALREGFDVLTHPANRGYGANQKTCYTRAALDGADIVVMVHADNQYDPALVAEMVRPIEEGFADVVIGSRLLEDETIAGGMPRWKWIGNRFLTWVENRGFRRALLGVPHGLPRLLGGLPALDPVPPQQRRLRVRPGDLRPDRGPRRPRGGAGDPHALLPRGLERLLPDQRDLRAAHPRRARPLQDRRAEGQLAAPSARRPLSSPRRKRRLGTRRRFGS